MWDKYAKADLKEKKSKNYSYKLDFFKGEFNFKIS